MRRRQGCWRRNDSCGNEERWLSAAARGLFVLQRRRPQPAAEAGRSCWGSGQQYACLLNTGKNFGKSGFSSAVGSSDHQHFPILNIKTDVVHQAAHFPFFIHFKSQVLYFQHIYTSFVFFTFLLECTPYGKRCQHFLVSFRTCLKHALGKYH